MKRHRNLENLDNRKQNRLRQLQSVPGTGRTGDSISVRGVIYDFVDGKWEQQSNGANAGVLQQEIRVEVREREAADEDFLTEPEVDARALAVITAALIKTRYESNDDTNAFTDALLSKLNGLEALRDAAETYALIQSLLDYNDLLNKPTIPTLRNAAQTYALIQNLLDYDDLDNQPTILSESQVNALIEEYGEPFTTALLNKLGGIEDEAKDDLTADEIVDLIEAQTGDGRLDAAHIRNIQQAQFDATAAQLRTTLVGVTELAEPGDGIDFVSLTNGKTRIQIDVTDILGIGLDELSGNLVVDPSEVVTQIREALETLTTNARLRFDALRAFAGNGIEFLTNQTTGLGGSLDPLSGWLGTLSRYLQMHVTHRSGDAHYSTTSLTRYGYYLRSPLRPPPVYYPLHPALSLLGHSNLLGGSLDPLSGWLGTLSRYLQMHVTHRSGDAHYSTTSLTRYGYYLRSPLRPPPVYYPLHPALSLLGHSNLLGGSLDPLSGWLGTLSRYLQMHVTHRSGDAHYSTTSLTRYGYYLRSPLRPPPVYYPLHPALSLLGHSNLLGGSLDPLSGWLGTLSRYLQMHVTHRSGDAHYSTTSLTRYGYYLRSPLRPPPVYYPLHPALSLLGHSNLLTTLQVDLSDLAGTGLDVVGNKLVVDATENAGNIRTALETLLNNERLRFDALRAFAGNGIEFLTNQTTGLTTLQVDLSDLAGTGLDVVGNKLVVDATENAGNIRTALETLLNNERLRFDALRAFAGNGIEFLTNQTTGLTTLQVDLSDLAGTGLDVVGNKLVVDATESLVAGTGISFTNLGGGRIRIDAT